MTLSKDRLDNSALAAQLASTQSLIQGLLKEIRDSSVAQASLKSDLKSLRYSVTMLSNIIRGGDSGTKSILTEVELLKKCSEDLEEQVGDLSISMAKKIDGGLMVLGGQVEGIQRKMSQDETDKRANETIKIQLQQQSASDLRLDKRQRLAVWATIIVAIIASAASIVSLFLNRGG